MSSALASLAADIAKTVLDLIFAIRVLPAGQIQEKSFVQNSINHWQNRIGSGFQTFAKNERVDANLKVKPINDVIMTQTNNNETNAMHERGSDDRGEIAQFEIKLQDRISKSSWGDLWSRK